MASKTIQPVESVEGNLAVPGDKSMSHRAVILGALSNRTCVVSNFLESEDCQRTVRAFEQMGIGIERKADHLQIAGKGLDGLKPPSGPIDCGNSGTTTRLLMGVLTGQPFDVELVGDASLSRRPMGRVIDPLSKMGAFFPSAAQTLPLHMRGTRDVKTLFWKSPVASAQVKSAILLAGLYASGTTEVCEPQLSRDHTERMLQASGVSLERSGTCVRVQGMATIRAARFEVPGDFSSAAFFLAAGLLRATRGEIVLQRVGTNPTRTGFLDVISAMGGTCRQLRVTDAGGEPVADLAVRASSLKGTVVGGALIPRAIDEIPLLALLATQAQGRTTITDAAELRVKESDRLAALREELSKMGARISETKDGLIIDGPTLLQGAIVNSHGDHRLAMTLAIAALVARGPTTIDDVDCVATSFPNFWDLLDRIRDSSAKQAPGS